MQYHYPEDIKNIIYENIPVIIKGQEDQSDKEYQRNPFENLGHSLCQYGF